MYKHFYINHFPLEYDEIEDIVGAVIDFVFVLSIAVAPVVVLVGAFNIMTAGGNPEKVKKGTQIILYAAIGFGVILFAKGIISVIKHVLGVEAQ